MFGASDGATSVVGVLLTLAGHPGQIVPASLGLAVAGGIGMCAGQWLSDDSDAGLGEALAIGAATAVGTLLPAVPYLVLAGAEAMACSGLLLVLIGALITMVRSRTSGRGWWRAAAETYGALAAVALAVALCALVTGAGG